MSFPQLRWERAMSSGLNVAELTAFAHDTRTHVRSIVVTSQMLLRRPGLDGEVVRTLEKVISDAKQIDGLTTATVNYVCLAGASEAPLRATKLPTLLRGLVLEMGPAVSKANGQLTVGDAPAVMVPAGLSWILRELICNSLKFVTDKSPEITVDTELTGTTVAVRVKDNGPGLPAERVDEAFSPYKRLHRQIPGGYGLGLPTAMRIAEVCGGSLATGPTREGCEILIHWPISDLGADESMER